MIEVNKLSSFDNFFYYGKNDFDLEMESDLMQVIVQPKRSLLYNNRFGAGVQNKENYPNALNLQIGLRFDIVNAIAYRNTVVTDGEDDTRDRRIAASQFSIEFTQKSGDTDIRIYYFSFENTDNIRLLNVESGRVL